MVTSQCYTRQIVAADTVSDLFPVIKMFAVNRFVVAPSATVSTGAQNRGARRSAAAYELTERPQVAGSHRLLLGEMSAALKQRHD